MKYLNKSFTVSIISNSKEPSCVMCGLSAKVYHITKGGYFCPVCWERKKLLDRVHTTDNPNATPMQGLGELGKL